MMVAPSVGTSHPMTAWLEGLARALETDERPGDPLVRLALLQALIASHSIAIVWEDSLLGEAD